MHMTARAKDEEREERIHMEIIVDAYGPEEQAAGWYNYLSDTLQFPFSARCVARRVISLYHHCQQQSERVDQDMTFAPFHSLATIIAPHTGQGCRFHALAIQGYSGGLLVATGSLTHLGSERVVKSLPRSIITPRAKIRVPTLPGRILTRQHAPLAATDHDVQDTVDDCSHV
jgi:hypothetical protein